jgi:hypothetical protein
MQHECALSFEGFAVPAVCPLCGAPMTVVITPNVRLPDGRVICPPCAKKHANVLGAAVLLYFLWHLGMLHKPTPLAQ